MVEIIGLIAYCLSSFFTWFASLVVYSQSGITIYLYELIIFGAVVLPFLFSMISYKE